jgi:hypothetical protein
VAALCARLTTDKDDFFTPSHLRFPCRARSATKTSVRQENYSERQLLNYTSVSGKGAGHAPPIQSDGSEQ